MGAGGLFQIPFQPEKCTPPLWRYYQYHICLHSLKIFIVTCYVALPFFYNYVNVISTVILHTRTQGQFFSQIQLSSNRKLSSLFSLLQSLKLYIIGSIKNLPIPFQNTFKKYVV